MEAGDESWPSGKSCERLRDYASPNACKFCWTPLGVGIQQLRGTGYIAEKDLILVPEKKGLVHLVFQRLFWQIFGETLGMHCQCFFKKHRPPFLFGTLSACTCTWLLAMVSIYHSLSGFAIALCLSQYTQSETYWNHAACVAKQRSL